MVQTPTTPGQMSSKLKMRGTPPANQTQCFRALMHHVSLACSRMQTYSGQMYPQLTLVPQSTTTPGQFDMWQNADGQMSPDLTLVLQSTTTPGECDMWKNSDVPMSDYIPHTN